MSIKYTERLAEAGIEPSVGSVGDSYDNALAETVIGLFKTEVIHRRSPWRSFEAVEFATLEWVDWFNNRRLLASIGSIPSAEAEAAYYAQLEIMPMAASNPSQSASGKFGTVHIAMLLPMDGHASHDQLPDPPPRSTSQKLAAFPILDRTAVTVSGLSSGGFFVHQFHVAFSSLVKGAGIITGGPFGCVETIPNPWSPFWPAFLDRVSAAVVACTHYYGLRR